jgi:hypothetical protein
MKNKFCVLLGHKGTKTRNIYIRFFFHSCTVHLDTIKFYFYPTDAQLNIPRKKHTKIYIKINIKSAPTCFGLNNHQQGAWRFCFAKVIIIKIVS